MVIAITGEQRLKIRACLFARQFKVILETWKGALQDYLVPDVTSRFESNTISDDELLDHRLLG